MTAIDIPSAAAPSSAHPLPAAVAEREASRARPALLAWWAVLLIVGALQAWSARHYVNPDGVSYLDLSDRAAAGRWGQAISSYWSPLLPWLLGLAVRLVRPSPYFEATLAHLVLYATYVSSAASFEFLRRELSRRAAWLWSPFGIAVSYTLFVWSGIALVGLEKLTPDPLVAAVVFAATALLLRAERGVGGGRTYVMLGATLGVGYWAKAALFPAAFAFLAAAAVAAWRSGRAGSGKAHPRGPSAGAVSRALLALLAFALVAAPLVVALSVAKGAPTFGEVGRLAYGWFVNGYPQFWWTGEPAGSGSPVHPIRQLMQEPRVFEFGGEVEGTYPLWLDPSYWYQGLAVRMAPLRQLDRLLRGVRDYVALFGVLVGLSLLPAVISGGARGVVRAARRAAVAVLPAVAMLGLYALVLVESRYVAAPAVVLCLALLAASLPLESLRQPTARAAALSAGGAVMLVAGVTLAPLVAPTLRALWQQARDGEAAHRDWVIARHLREAGVRPGDAVGTISGTTMLAYWPRAAGVRVVAEAPDDPRSWEAVGRVTATLFAAGVRAVVLDPAYRPPGPAPAGTGWVSLGDTGYAVRLNR